MTRTKLFLLSPVLVAGLFTLFATDPPARAEDGAENSLVARVEALENRIAELEETVAAQQEVILDNEMKLMPVELSFDDINGLAGPHLIITGVNVHVRSGSGATNAAVNGRGNLIVGYNEIENFTAPRIGSHNLVVGRANGYSSFGGLVAGAANNVVAPWASISGGQGNEASGFASSVSGGFRNFATRTHSSVSGGHGRAATGNRDWAAGSLYEDD